MLILRATVLLLVVAALVQGRASAAAPERSHVQVVAHPDDDILFMNPDVQIAIRSGAAVTSIYLTAGESDVRPADQYAAQRQAGTRAAFAQMAGVADDWDRLETVLRGRHVVEIASLRARPEIRLVFVNLPDDNDPAAVGGRHALTRMWQDGRSRVNTLVPNGSALTRSSTYDRQEVISMLADLYERFAPTVLRTHDPEPDPRYQPQWEPHFNHPDHVMTARFAMAALGNRRTHTYRYRDYNIADSPMNLPGNLVAEKRETFGRYAVHDPVVSMLDPYATWLRSMRLRWPRSPAWAATDIRGRPVFAFVSGQRVHVGNRVVSTPGFVPLEGSPVLAPGPSGALVLAVQASGTGEIFLNRQDLSGRWQRWVNLGRPPGGGVTHVGPPAVIAGQAGVVVAVRNGRGGVSVDQGSGWVDIGGAELADQIAITLDSQAALHVFATARSGLLHWRQAGRFELVAPPEKFRPSGGVAVARSPGGFGFAAFREVASGRVVVLAERVGWERLVSVDASALSDPVLAVDSADVPMLAFRDSGGTATVLEPMTGTRHVLEGQTRQACPR
ncbi:PIG-L family deacetylase [Saccharopolyspora taberi]|uniref:PIG-L family deacetylase n=1 Tax=Saccharopolyspora taberi TaxID=60895 RepID=A0ABN3VCA5_9PSEU